MKELDLSCLICALDLKVAQKFPEDARTAKGCSKRQVAQRLPGTIGTGLVK